LEKNKANSAINGMRMKKASINAGLWPQRSKNSPKVIDLVLKSKVVKYVSG